MQGAAGADVFEGDAGTDTADYSDRTAAIMITINGTADDGATSEMDNVGTDLEIILGGGGADMITGYSLLGADHNETLMGGAGADTISGLGGNDLINGDDGDDSLTGGAGADTINGGNGDDKINSTIPTDPNEADTVDGGAGTDTATRDLVDVLTNVEIEM